MKFVFAYPSFKVSVESSKSCTFLKDLTSATTLLTRPNNIAYHYRPSYTLYFIIIIVLSFLSGPIGQPYKLQNIVSFNNFGMEMKK